MDNLLIKDILQKDITRRINGVIKADSNQEETIITELSEYVVTDEIRKHLTTLFERYVDSFNSPTEDIGVWISGFFGSGKSHFLKMIGHIFSNKTYAGKKASEYFSEKIDDAILLGNIEKASSANTDVILFNIDNVSDQDSRQNRDTIVVAFFKKFNEYLGFSRDDIKIAEFERELWKEGKFEEFKRLFEEESGKTWKEGMRNLSFHEEPFIDIVEKMNIMSRESAERWLEKEIVKSINVDNFSETLEEYLKIKGPKHRVVFLVDEIGQYIGDTSELMLNLQTLVETLGVKFKGRVWVGVTSQQDLGVILNSNIRKRNDFSKIQDRFKTILALSSANIDEVIKKRLLAKKLIEKEDLEKLYDKKRVEIENLINFNKNDATLILYKDRNDFAETYPFVGYQFNLLQKVFEKVRELGFTGQHMSRGERSLLNSYQEAGIKIKDEKIGCIVPLYIFYNSIEQFLGDNIRRPIIHAEKDKGIDEFGVNVLKLLFLLKGIQDVEPNLDILTSFMVDSLDCDRVKLAGDIKNALDRLEREVLIQRDGDKYYFLTNEEQDINKEINRELFEEKDVYRQIDETIFTEIFEKVNIVIPDTGSKYTFTKKIDDNLMGKVQGELSISIFTPMSDQYDNALSLSMRDEYNLIVKLPENEKTYIEEIKQYLRVNSYIKRRSSENNSESINLIFKAKQQENNIRKKRIKSSLEVALGAAEVFVRGSKENIKTENPVKVLEEAFRALANSIFLKASLLKEKYDDKKIKDLLSYEYENTQSSLFKIEKEIENNKNSSAIKEVLDSIFLSTRRGNDITLKSLSDKFTKAPYGWEQLSVNGIVAELWNYKKINVENGKVAIKTAEEAKDLFVRIQTSTLERIVIKQKEEVDEELIRKVNNLLKEVFGDIDIITSDNPKESLITSLRSKVKIANDHKNKYERNEKYPGKKEVQEWISFEKDMESFSTTSDEKFLKEFLKAEDEFKKIYDDFDKVNDFFKSNKVNKFDMALKKIEKIDNSYGNDIGDIKNNKAYKRLLEIVNNSEPYSSIREIDDLILEIEKEEQALINTERETLKEKVNSKVEELSNKFKNEESFKKLKENVFNFLKEIEKIKDTSIFIKYRKIEDIINEFEKAYKNEYRRKIEDFQNKLLTVAEDKSDVEELEKDIKNTYVPYLSLVMESGIEKIKDIVEAAENEGKRLILQIEGKAKKKEKVNVARFKLSSEYNIETEEAVLKYIEKYEEELKKLKEELLKEVRANKIVSIN